MADGSEKTGGNNDLAKKAALGVALAAAFATEPGCKTAISPKPSISARSAAPVKTLSHNRSRPDLFDAAAAIDSYRETQKWDTTLSPQAQAIYNDLVAKFSAIKFDSDEKRKEFRNELSNLNAAKPTLRTEVAGALMMKAAYSGQQEAGLIGDVLALVDGADKTRFVLSSPQETVRLVSPIALITGALPQIDMKGGGYLLAPHWDDYGQDMVKSQMAEVRSNSR